MKLQILVGSIIILTVLLYSVFIYNEMKEAETYKLEVCENNGFSYYDAPNYDEFRCYNKIVHDDGSITKLYSQGIYYYYD